MEEIFSFVDKETGDVVEIGELDTRDSISRAFAGFGATVLNNGPVAVEHDFYRTEKLQSFIPYEVASSSAQKTAAIAFEVASPCAKKPRTISPSHFYASQSNYLIVKSNIDQCLKSRTELVHSPFPSKQMWKCKYLEGSQCREVHVTCFWDMTKKDHVVEVKRVHGDGLFPQYTDLSTLLQEALGLPVSVKKTAPRKVNLSSLPPPMTARKTGLESLVDGSMRVIHEMARNVFYEARVESVKMLCDFAARTELATLQLPCAKTDILDMLFKFLQDEFDDIVEFAVVCLHTLVQRCPEYVVELRKHCAGAMLPLLSLHSDAQPESLMTSGDVEEESDSYLFAQMRRMATEVLRLVMLTSASVEQQQHLQQQQQHLPWTTSVASAATTVPASIDF